MEEIEVAARRVRALIQAKESRELAAWQTTWRIQQQAQSLARLDGSRDVAGWMRRAEQSSLPTGDYLERRIAATQERQAFDILRQVARQQAQVPEEVLEPQRQRIAQEHGISQGLATSLGWESVAQLTGQG